MTKQNRDMALVSSVFEQHWIHARHVENLRLVLTGGYSALVGGLLGALGDKFLMVESLPLHVFLIALSVFGVLFSIKVDAIFKGHTRRAELILKEFDIPLMEEGLLADHWVNRRLSISRLYPFYFSLCGCWIWGALLWAWSGWLLLALLLPSLVALVALFLLHRLDYDHSNKPRLHLPNQVAKNSSASEDPEGGVSEAEATS